MGRVGSNAAEQSTAGLGDIPSIEQLAPIFPQLEIMELIGRGGMGFVFKARQLHLDREVALKLLPEKLGADPHFAERFTREARVLARLSHPNIVMVHDFGHAGGFYYLVMEHVEGMNLRQAMRMGKFSPSEALAIVPKICGALQYAHEQGVLHRDIKPENILLDARGGLKIADFGIAKMLGEETAAITLTGTGSALGTPHYMAPEQFENPSQVDHRADIYSLGVVFYEMLTGELPLGRFEAPSKRTDLDERIDAVVLRALARERELRQKDARELQSQVETLATTAAPRNGLPATRTMSFADLWSKRWKIAAALGVFLCLFIAFQNWRSVKYWEQAYWEMVHQRDAAQPPVLQAPPAMLEGDKVPEPFYETGTAVTNAVIAAADSEKLQRQEEKIAAARERYETARDRHSRGEIPDRELALANRDLIMAEARGDAAKIARADYDFAMWEYMELAKKDPENQDARWDAEQLVNKAQHSLERARATNELQKAFADLKYAEHALGSGQRRRDLRIERNGVVTNFISAEALKKLENDYFYSELNYKRMKEKLDPAP